MILRSSSVVTLLDSSLTWEDLPLFFTIQYIPELLDGWMIVVYLRYLGVDWSIFVNPLKSNPRAFLAKLGTLVTPILYIFVVAMGK